MQSKGQITGVLSPVLENYRIQQIIHEVSGKRILDYGCGQGKMAENLSFTRYVGVDLNKEVIVSAKKNHRNQINAFFYDTDEFSNNLEKFDTIILSAVIEHFDNPKSYLIDLRRRLEKGGEIIITTPSSVGNRILHFGSLFRLFSKEALDEHNVIFSKKDFYTLVPILEMSIIKYKTFEFGLNQLVVFRDEL